MGSLNDEMSSVTDDFTSLCSIVARRRQNAEPLPLRGKEDWRNDQTRRGATFSAEGCKFKLYLPLVQQTVAVEGRRVTPRLP